MNMKRSCLLSFFLCCSLSFLSADVQTAWQEMMQGSKVRDCSSFTPVQAEASSAVLHPYTPFYSKKVGFILLAGGQGSRLGAEIPKGMVPIPPSNKTLFEIFARRMVGFYKVYHQWPFCAIMTSQETDVQTREYFKEQHFFGVPEENVGFFCQSSLPLLNEKGEVLVENGTLVTGPDGNGKIFTCFLSSGLYQTWKDKGVEAVSILPIDNPLMDTFLPSLFQPVVEGKTESSFAAILRRSSTEKVGVFFAENDKPCVVEYSEISDQLRNALASDGSLLHKWANISVMCLSMKSIESLSSVPLPLHFAKKMRNGAPIYKGEYFIFDNFPFLSTFALVGLDRARYFSPIKSKTGDDSLEQASLAFRRVQEAQARRAGIELFEGEDASNIDPADLYVGN